MSGANIQACYLLNYSIKENLHIYIAQLWYDVWVLTVAFLINFLGKYLILNFLKMQK